MDAGWRKYSTQRRTDGRTDGRTDARPFLWILTRRDASEGAKKGLRSRLAYLSRFFAVFLGSANSENAFERGFLEMLLQHH